MHLLLSVLCLSAFLVPALSYTLPELLVERQSIGFGACNASCPSTSGIIALERLPGCASGDKFCFCTNTYDLDAVCQGCISTLYSLTQDQYAALCPGSFEVGSGTLPAGPAVTGPTGPSTCLSSCNGTKDATAYPQVLACDITSLTYTTCCTPLEAISSGCHNCVFMSLGMSETTFDVGCNVDGLGDAVTGSAGAGSSATSPGANGAGGAGPTSTSAGASAAGTTASSGASPSSSHSSAPPTRVALGGVFGSLLLGLIAVLI
ncbi:hypothetical protein CALCODRAFT_513062 [Calocera cornea HHB12733]|uniref:Extracellular membrane protein CFEM domain-containing protein n=1 Tax=Calocera cornea HHB12733 TaxID=1353952 RepID=A0A165CI78_9BASI|nr:hypothetical protein CALCODRAFT_513062 [Calocera cornea HHB12733]